MKDKIKIKPMTPKMYHAFFREYENDTDEQRKYYRIVRNNDLEVTT